MTDTLNRETLLAIAEDQSLLDVGRKAIEDVLITWRDGRLSELGRRNGLVIREKDGTASDVIRFGPEAALRIGLLAIAKHLEERKN
jgi:hypothetical protein